MNINFDELKNTILNFIVPIVALLISLGLILVVVIPGFSSYKQNTLTLQEKEKLDNQLAEKIKDLNRLIDFRDIVDEDAELVSKVLSDEAKVPELLTQVDRIAGNSGLEVSKLNYALSGGAPGEENASGSEDSASVASVVVNLGVSGQLKQLQVFLEAIEVAARMINVDSLRYSQTDTRDGIEFSASLVLSSPYFFVQSDAVTDDPIDLELDDAEFIDLINKIKDLTYYDISIEDIQNIEVVEESEDTAPEELSPEDLEEPQTGLDGDGVEVPQEVLDQISETQ